MVIEFVDCNRVIFVDNRNNAPFKQRIKRVKNVLATLRIVQNVMRQQHLADLLTIRRKTLLVNRHQFALPH